MPKRYSAYFSLICLLLVHRVSFADFPQTQLHFTMLPPYCLAQMRPQWAPPGDPQKWSKKLGSGYAHLHHYCAALHSLRLAQEITGVSKKQKETRLSKLREVMTNIQYMEDKAEPSFVLFSHIYTTKAEALFELGQPKDAVDSLNMAIERNKKFPKPYRLLADYYVKQGKQNEARDILQEGLKHSPDSKILMKKLQKLGK